MHISFMMTHLAYELFGCSFHTCAKTKSYLFYLECEINCFCLVAIASGRKEAKRVGRSPQTVNENCVIDVCFSILSPLGLTKNIAAQK